jgi:hypothetical protein
VAIWHRFLGLDPNLAVGLLTAATTILGGTLAIALGRYFERKKEIEAHYREKKTAIYDSFLQEFFRIFHNEGDEPVDIVPFLREWQRQMILWGGTNVLNAYFKWRMNLGKGTPDAQTMFLADEFFRAIRKDIGLSNLGLERGAFIRLLLKNPDLFFVMARENPNVQLTEIALKEKELGIQ